MKFKDKDGNVFEDIEKAWGMFCEDKDCDTCPIDEFMNGTLLPCETFVQNYPTEAAHLMGYEVVEDEAKAVKGMCCDCTHDKSGNCCDWDENEKCPHWRADGSCWVAYTGEEDKMDKQKPRICEVLGVEVGERFRVESDLLCLYDNAFVDEDGVIYESIGKEMRGVRICQIVSGKLHIIHQPRFTEEEVEDARAIMGFFQTAYTVERYLDTTLGVRSRECFIANITNSKFPSIRPGQSVRLSEIVGGAE